MLSVFIPSYNHARYVTQAIASARAIDMPDKHIYVIDDASTDDSADVIGAYLAETDAQDVTFIRKPENKGSIDSMLMFMGLCRTEYIYSVASDDIVIADGIAELVRRLEEKPSLQFVIGGGKNLFPDGLMTQIYRKKHVDLFNLPPERFAKSIFLIDSSPLLCQSTVFRTSALRAIDAVVADVIADDYAIFSKLFLHFNRRGVDYDFLPHIDCVHYRHHGNNSYRRILRQVTTSLQVLELTAPPQIRDQAIAYKLGYFMIVGARRGDFSSVWQIAKMVRLRHLPWILPGIAINTYWWGKKQ